MLEPPENNRGVTSAGAENVIPARRNIKLAAALLPVLAFLILLLVSLFQTNEYPGGLVINNSFSDKSIQDKEANDFSLDLYNGETLQLSALRGKVVVLDFWSSWCPPCRVEASLLAETYDRFQNRGVEFVGITIWDSEEEALKFIQAFGINYPNGLDSNGKIAIDYGIRGIPEKFFLDRDGLLVRRYSGPLSEQQLELVLEEMLIQ